MSPTHPAVTDLAALAQLAPELASTFATIASDIALVIDADGVIRNAALGEAAIGRGADQWVGCRFADTVTQDTRGKIEQMLHDVRQTGVSRRREVNLPGEGGASIPVAFAAIRLGADGPVLAVGRDLRAVAAIQQRFVHAQQELERDYWRQRQTETRHRQLFQVATDAVLVVDAASLTVVQANRAAAELFGREQPRMAGLPAVAGIDLAFRPAVEALLSAARASGRPAEIRARLGRPGGQTASAALVDVSATPFRSRSDASSPPLLLMRMRRAEARGGDSARRLAEFVERTPDALAITDSHGRLQAANPSFHALCAGDGRSAIGRTLVELLGDPAGRLGGLITAVRHLGLANEARVPTGSHEDPLRLQQVEVSASLLAEGDQECIGFTLRRPPVPQGGVMEPAQGLGEAIEALTARLGHTPLPELMQEASRVAERHLILAALAHAKGHAPTAAGWLGITPDSLSLRLMRHGLMADGDAPSLLN